MLKVGPGYSATVYTPTLHKKYFQTQPNRLFKYNNLSIGIIEAGLGNSYRSHPTILYAL